MQTPLSPYPRLSTLLGIDLKVKHDDLYPFPGGGSKARKIKYIIQDAIDKQCNALVSAGAANSNHARVVAIKAAQLGWPVKLIIHDKEDYSKANLQLMKLAGAELIFCKLEDVAQIMDKAMDDFVKSGNKPYYIWGGGHSVEGTLAYYYAVKEFKEQAHGWEPDYVVVASGTGGTQAGIHLGFNDFYPNAKVLGISVARNKERGFKIVRESVEELAEKLKTKNKNEIFFLDDWTGGGYENVTEEIEETIRFAAKQEGLILDPTYTGKAFAAIMKLTQNNTIPPQSKVLFWHTGGMLNLIS